MVSLLSFPKTVHAAKVRTGTSTARESTKPRERAAACSRFIWLRFLRDLKRLLRILVIYAGSFLKTKVDICNYKLYSSYCNNTRYS